MKSNDLLKTSSKTVSVVVPVYNSEASLPALVERLDASLSGCCRDFEIILVNDGSRDNSWKTIKALSERFPQVCGISLMRNYGQHNAILCGIRESKYDIIVTIDDDLQNPPEEVPRLLDALIEECDVVYGVPRAPQHGIWRNLASVVTKMALKGFMGAKQARNVSAFRIFRTQLRDAFAHYDGSFVSIDVLLTWATNRFSSIPVLHDTRCFGKSNYTVSRLFKHAINMMTGFSIFPLQVASFLGFACTFFGLCILLYVIINFIQHGSQVPGFAFLASIIAIFSGAQLLALGIIGEYLARMHFRSLGVPSSVIKEKTSRQERIS